MTRPPRFPGRHLCIIKNEFFLNYTCKSYSNQNSNGDICCFYVEELKFDSKCLLQLSYSFTKTKGTMRDQNLSHCLKRGTSLGFACLFKES